MTRLRKRTTFFLASVVGILVTFSIYSNKITEIDVIPDVGSDRVTTAERIRPRPMSDRVNTTDRILARLPILKSDKANTTERILPREYGTVSMSGDVNHLHRVVLSNSSEPSKTSGTPQFQIQYWGEAKFSLSAGTYYCPNLDASVRYTTEKGYDVMKKSNVTIFYQVGDWDAETLKRVRRKDQILAYWSLESPRHSSAAQDLSVFNLTMTYRQASDFFLPYGRMTPFTSSKNTGRVKPELKTNYAEGKTKLAAWVASNCRTSGLYEPSWPRQAFVKTLQKYMPVDTFGSCGDMPCHDCIKQMNTYKFYLAFENDQCEDYITEKLFRNAFLQGTVPIVFGARRSDYEKFVPKGSFIYVSDFPTVSSLVEYIKIIDKNDHLYNRFFDWRKDFYPEFIDENDHLDVEKLCELVSRYYFPEYNEGYVDKTKWFHSSCYTTPIPRDE